MNKRDPLLLKWDNLQNLIVNNSAGYAVNFGNLPAPKTVKVTGVVSNGTQTTTLFNHNRTFTTGFNLVGNPYPSPIDWFASSGWTKTNIDNAIYFFDSSAAFDEYSGVYCSFVNGISTGGSTNIIPSMQGFFVHVSDGTYPVTGSLKMMTTDKMVPNIYAFTTDIRKVSISGIPAPKDNLTRIPIGIKTSHEGWISLDAIDISLLPTSQNIYLVD